MPVPPPIVGTTSRAFWVSQLSLFFASVFFNGSSASCLLAGYPPPSTPAPPNGAAPPSACPLGTMFSVWLCSQVFGMRSGAALDRSAGCIGRVAVRRVLRRPRPALVDSWRLPQRRGGFAAGRSRARTNPWQRVPGGRHGADSDVLAALPASAGRGLGAAAGVGRPGDHCPGLESPRPGDAQRIDHAAQRPGLQQPDAHSLPKTRQRTGVQWCRPTTRPSTARRSPPRT